MHLALRSSFGMLALLMLTVLAGAVSTCAAPPSVAMESTALTEEQKIDRLIALIADMKDASFVRKGQEYDAASAAKFLREKWNWMKSDDCKTARDFVRVASGGNLGTGTPYFIKFSDGRQVASSDFLGEQLAKLEAAETVAATQPAN